MKKLLILLLSISLLVACKNDKTNSSSDTEKTSKDDYRNGDSDSENDKDKKDDDNGGVDRNSGNFDDVVDDDEEGNHVAESSNWSSNDIKTFTTGCVSESIKGGFTSEKANSYCNCMLRKLSTQYPNSKDLNGLDENSPSMQAMAKDCLGIGTQKTSSSASNSPGWTRKQELDFVNSCVREAVKGGMEDLDAQSYCDCMQYKIEKLYPSYVEANRLTEADLKKPSMQKMIDDCLPGN